MYDDAKKTYIDLLESDYYNDTNHAFYASFLTDIGDYSGAYKEREIAAILDLNDAGHLIALGIFMINHHYTRKDQETIIKIKQTHEIFNYIMPLFIKAVDIDSSNDKRTRVAEILVKRHQNNYAQAIIDQKPIDSSTFIQYPLDYILSADIDKIKASK